MEHNDYVSIRFGTDVTRGILDRLGSPDDCLKIIHIAGTNGKGSTAEFFTCILKSAGRKVGTFTSPAVYDFYDQFRINGEIIPKEKAESYFDAAKKAAEGTGATDFEIQTAGIIYAFFKEGCEYAVIECGMGGLGDATNAINKKELAVITSVSLEHTAYLGDTIKKICSQKAGIIKDGCPAVGNAIQPEEAKKYLQSRGVRLADGVIYGGGKEFYFQGKKYKISAEGCYQPYNAATAIAGARILGVDEKSIFDGIQNAEPRGRIEKAYACGRTYILDGAHNPAAFIPLHNYIRGLPREEITLIYGSLYDKDIDANLKILSELTGSIIAVECISPRAMPLEKIRNVCRKYFENVSTANSVSDALNAVNTKTAVVCGSFTLLSEAKQWLENSTGKRR